jgi:AraC-like DNA-binding protein
VSSGTSDALFLVQPSLAATEAAQPLVYRELPPPAPARDALLVWSLASRRPLERAFAYHIVPDGCVDLVFDLRGGGAWLYGASAAPARAELVGHVDLFGVRLRPGRPGRALGAQGGDIAGRVIELDDVLPARGGPARGWIDELAAAPGGRARADAVARRLAALARAGSPADRIGEAIADAIFRAGGAAGVEELARRFSLGARHVRRVCRAATGLSPKQLSRLVRFQAALRALAAAPARNLASLAADHGYFDQAHLTGEFRALLGVTPATAARAVASGISKTGSAASGS